MEENFEQHTIEFFFKKFGVTDPDQKAKLLPLVTDVIYEYNMHVVKFEKEQDENRKSALVADLQEIEAKIANIFTKESE
ncbi:MAG: hypothetical protein COX80_02025 [Candidatus Magasanikbacteria bacterium CG_4_10_14_0_2_um_filter_33_14]|uniref:Uncharacterized protein n=1 Tax=Candidatus Magasanikbacteria bacterium CG_4_10_14_0_2_um_filter_33_14 TaxID=1974636 RepID=A0A2M7VB83_9BACT|nr:MAG: hypothetical protein COX80_02025 [Candidatus Magasanikbacteria bacterium CG_4_10_14_0_2_um_filter_33_14]